jgi:hypothetical protein
MLAGSPAPSIYPDVAGAVLEGNRMPAQQADDFVGHILLNVLQQLTATLSMNRIDLHPFDSPE